MPDHHHSSDDVYCKEGAYTLIIIMIIDNQRRRSGIRAQSIGLTEMQPSVVKKIQCNKYRLSHKISRTLQVASEWPTLRMLQV